MKFFFLLLVIFVLFTPVILNAQFTDACAQASADAQKEVNGTMWLAIGFLLGFPIGWPLLPMLLEPSPPAAKLLGMPPDYVTSYTSCFKDEGKKVQQSAALKGCIIGAVIYLGCYIIYYILLLGSLSTI